MAKRSSVARDATVLILFTLTLMFAACGASNATSGGGADAGLANGGVTDAGLVDGGAAFIDAGADDAGSSNDGGACSNDSQCALAHRCVLGVCRAHRGGTGTPCPNGDECAVDALCTGATFATTGPICIRACSGSTCPGDYTCQFFERVRDGGAPAIVYVCLPRNAFGIPCLNGDDPTYECTVPGQYCGARSREVGATYLAGYCVDADNCNFAAQTGCAPNETCVPAGALGYDNNRATVCEAASATGGGQGEPCGACRPGYRCVALSSRHSVCLKYCTPNDPNHNCAGVPALSTEIACATGNHTPLLCPDGGSLTDGGVSGDAQCFDILSGALAPLSSLPVGVCF